MRSGYFCLAGAALLLGGCDRLASFSSQRQEQAQQPTRPVATKAQGATPVVSVAGTTPMGERVAVLGFLNKRNGIERDISIKPGQSIRVRDDVIVRLRACETTPPWQFDKWTGAFVQLDVRQSEGLWRRAFSG